MMDSFFLVIRVIRALFAVCWAELVSRTSGPGFLLACIPYVFVRGPTVRLWQWIQQKRAEGAISWMRR